MNPYLQDADFTLYNGDSLDVLRTLPDECVDCVITSPPYWGLRDYGTGEWEGGDEECDHRHVTEHQKQGATSQRAGRTNVEEQRNENYRSVCGRCGATRIDSQLGLEPTPEEYVTRMVEVFREVRRVLAAHGTCWVNMGDSYATGGSGATDNAHHKGEAWHAEGYKEPFRAGRSYLGQPAPKTAVAGLKPKDLCGIPWRLAFALQADGWYLRSDIVWSKPNPMPESVTDRPTKAHEYVFLLSKQPRYFFDQEAVREKADSEQGGRMRGIQTDTRKTHGVGGGNQGLAAAKHRAALNGGYSGRNIRSVWEIATQPFPEAHFATFPEELVRRCLLAGCPEGGIVLDPFMGSGTVALVARKHGRRAVGIELNESYCKMAAKRTQQLGLFSEVA